MPVLENHTTQNERKTMEDEPKIPISNRKLVFWQSSINDQRRKIGV